MDKTKEIDIADRLLIGILNHKLKAGATKTDLIMLIMGIMDILEKKK